MNTSRLLLSAAGFVIALSAQLRADPVNYWRERERSVDIAAVTYHDGLWVASGRQMAWSTNGVVWRTSRIGTNSLQDAIYANGQFVAVGVEGDVLTAADGKTWELHDAPTMESLQGVAYGDGLYVAVGTGGATVSSRDAIDWTSHPSGTNVTLWGVAFGNGAFVAVGDHGVVLRSLDGTNWSSHASGVADYDYLRAITFAVGLFVAVGDNGTIITSQDGASWTRRTAPTSASLREIIYGAGRFLALGGFYGGPTLTSWNGLTWQSHLPGLQWGANDAAAGSNSFVAVSYNFIMQSDPFAPSGPVFVEELADQTFLEGYSSILFAPVSGTSPITYDWYKDGVLVQAGSLNRLHFSTTFTNEGNYFVIAANAFGSATSRVARVTVQPRPPSFVQDPGGFSVAEGTMVELYANPSGTEPFSVQWLRDGSPIPGATSIAHRIVNATSQTAGNYQLVANGPYGSATSSVARVEVDTLKPIDRWTSRRPTPPHSGRDITYGNGIFVAVGDRGAILSSSDAYVWSERTLPTSRSIYALEFADGKFVAVGEGGLVVTSRNGVDWTHREAGVSGNLMDLAFGNGVFIATGWDYTLQRSPYSTEVVILTSPDGIAWTRQQTPQEPGDHYLLSIAFGNGTFVAAPSYGDLLVSTDGVVWEPRSVGSPQYFSSVAFGNGVFVALSWSCTGWMSSDALTWTSGTAPCGDLKLDAPNGSIVAHRDCDDDDDDDDDNSYAPIQTQPEPLPITPVEGCLSGVTYGRGLYVGAGSDGIAVSTNLNDLALIGSGQKEPLYGVVWANNQFVAVGGYPNHYYYSYPFPTAGVVLNSPDGIRWTQRPSGTTNALFSVCFGNGLYVAVGTYGEILTSHDAVSWTRRDSGTIEGLSRVIFASGRFVAVGTQVVVTSTDAINWTPLSFPGIYSHDVAFGNDTFVAVGSYGALVSKDAVTWQTTRIAQYQTADSIAFGDGHFVAALTGGLIAISSDGRSWTIGAFPTGATAVGNYVSLTSIIYANEEFLAVGYAGAIWASRDGVAWTQRHSGTQQTCTGVAYGSGSYVMVSNGGEIRQSDPLVSKSPIITRQPQSLSVHSNETASFSVEVHGTAPLAYQWFKDGAALPVETNAALVLPDVQPAHSGLYRVKVANASGNASSDFARLQFGAGSGGGEPDPFAPDRWHLRHRHTSTEQFLFGVAYGNNTFVAVGAPGTILTSPNGYDWSRQVSGASFTLWNVTFGNNTFVALGEEGILVSPDAVTWSNRLPSVSTFFMDAIYAKGLWVVVAETGGIRVSSNNGATWTTIPVNAALRTVTFANDTFVAGGPNGAIRVSTNGLNWMPVTSPSSRILWGSAHGGGRFVIVGEYGTILTSTDGFNWSQVSSITTNNVVPPHFMDVIYEAGTFVAVGGASAGAVYTSYNGLEWTRRDTRVDLPFVHGVTFGQGAFMISCIGSTNAIYQSDPVRLTQPDFFRHLDDTAVRLGSPIDLVAIVTGTSPFTFNWYRDGALIAVSTNPVLKITNAQMADEGFYTLTASNNVGFASSGPVFLKVGVPPTILQHPLPQEAVPGGSVSFSVVAAGSPPFIYRWRMPGSIFTNFPSSEHESFFSVTGVDRSKAGIYGVIVTNEWGYANSLPARLTLLTDSDSDGMPDQWESAHGFDTNSLADAALDSDLDGATNLEEYNAGTNPTNAGSVLKLDATRAENAVALRFIAASNKTYTLQQSPGAVSAGWTKLQDFPARTTNHTRILQQMLQSTNGFYRAVTPRQP